MGIGSKLKKAARKVTGGKVGAALGVVAAPFTGGASLALTGAYALKRLTKTPSGAAVDTSQASQIIESSADNAKKARARLLATQGGILGEQLDEVQKKSGRNILGN